MAIAHFMDGKTAKEIAEESRTGLNTVKTHILQDLMLEVLELEARREQEKVVEFKRYRFRVLTTVAAAVLVVLLLPKVENLQPQGSEFKKPLTKSEYMTQSRYGSKEEALNDSSMLETMLGGVNIFADNNRLNLFRE